jgi:uncharacterized repeat protein (TIGR01451 family)
LTLAAGLQAFSNFSFRVKVIAFTNLTDDDWLKFIIKARADNNSSETNYKGDNKLLYGGDIGEDWKGVTGPAWYGHIFGQTPASNLLLINYPVVLSVSKTVRAITLENKTNDRAIPGFTIEYAIFYSNQSPLKAMNVIVSDRISSNLVYFSNSSVTNEAPGIWIREWSTNAVPDQVWNSSHYTNMEPAGFAKIKWVRWKKMMVPGSEKGFLKVKAIVK